jgi:hypothetical protein
MRNTDSEARGRTGATHRLVGFALIVLTLAVAGQPATAASVKETNLVDLIQHADTIVAGRVESVTDGFDGNGVPYTEVTLKVAEKVRGKNHEETFTFRQFGLLEPRTLPSGKTFLATVPDGWARFNEGEDVTLFLYAPAKATGLQTTVGLKQGKLAVVNGKIKRNEHNAALFENLIFAPGLLDTKEKALVSKGKGKKDLEVDEFLNLVRRAVDEDWIGNGRMQHEE